MKKKSTILKITTSLMCSAVLFACSNNSDTETETVAVTDLKVESLGTIGDADISSIVDKLVTYGEVDEYTDWKSANPTYIKLSGASATIEGSGGATVSGGIITIKTGGVYVLSGALADGQIVVEAEDKSAVRLVLNGAEITSTTSAPIYVKDAENTIISLEKGTENVLTDGSNYQQNENEEPNSTIFSKDNLTINGTGKLVVNANFNNGITSKDELRITGGDIEVNAVDDAIIGRDLVAVKDGSFSIKAGGDGIKATNDTEDNKGIVALQGGTFDVTSENDGVQAAGSLYVVDGTYNLVTGGGSPETVAPNPEMSRDQQTTTTTTTETTSAKALKAAVELAVGGGTFTIDALDDAIHSNSSVTIAGGEFDIETGDDGVHGDASVVLKDGKVTIAKSYEGIESKQIAIAGGEHSVTASDDGVNVGGGVDASAMDVEQSAAEDSVLSISGGTLFVDSEGDGLDSNGSMVMSGGTVVVNGPTNSGNGALDYNTTFDMNGGTLIASGSAGMIQSSSDNSTQASMLMMFDTTQAAGTLVHVEDSKGTEIATVAPKKEFGAIYISSPNMKEGSTYTLSTGGKSTGNEVYGLYKEGKYSGGTKVVDFKEESIATWVDKTGVTEAAAGHGGMGGGGRGGMKPDGERPDRGQMPADGQTSSDADTQ